MDQPDYNQSSVDGRVEREVALRLIASRAMVDQDFLDALRADPAAAIEALSLHLGEEDMARFGNLNWDAIQEHVDALRREVGLSQVMRGAW